MEELCGAAVRALTGRGDLHFRARGLYQAQRRVPLNAPHLRTDPAVDGLTDHRATADAAALRLCHSDDKLHRSLCPQVPIRRLVFELLEQLRVESLVPDKLPGSADNLAERFGNWSRAFHHAGLSDSMLGILLYTLAQVCWSRLNARPVLAETEDFIEATRAGIVPLLGHDLAALKRYRRDQTRYADAALSIAATIDAMVGEAASGAESEETANAEDEDLLAAFRLLLDFDEGDEQGVATVVTGRSRVFDETHGGYRVFDTRYDREVEAAHMVRPALLRELREQLDERVRGQAVNVPRLSRQLLALFARPERDDWLFGEDEGHVDGRRLAQLVVSPAERGLFRRERHMPVPVARVSLLIDCSGSMKAHIGAIAILVDVLGRALELAGIATEVLGFTTGAWNGGRVLRDWMARGRPANPGRLNEVSYMVYKDAATCWRRARPAIAAMLKPDLFREGIDGEAVDWACARMAGVDDMRRVLIVLSDGCPMDTATNLANDAYYLDNHLREVVAGHERQGDVEIYGLGVGLDLSAYYRHCLALDLSQGLNNGVFAELLQLLARSRTSRSRASLYS